MIQWLDSSFHQRGTHTTATRRRRSVATSRLRRDLQGACFQTPKAQLWLIMVQRIYFRSEWNFDRKHPANNTRGTEKQHRSVMALTSFIDIICTCAFHVQIFLFRIENLFAHANMRACADVHFLGLFRTAISPTKTRNLNPTSLYLISQYPFSTLLLLYLVAGYSRGLLLETLCPSLIGIIIVNDSMVTMTFVITINVSQNHRLDS